MPTCEEATNDLEAALELASTLEAAVIAAQMAHMDAMALIQTITEWLENNCTGEMRLTNDSTANADVDALLKMLKQAMPHVTAMKMALDAVCQALRVTPKKGGA